MLNKEYILKKIGKGLLHVFFWFGVLLFYTYFFGVGSTNFNQTLYFSLFLMPITIATTYVSIYILIPNYLITKQYFRFSLYSLYTLIVSAYLIFVSIFFSLIFLSDFEYDKMNPISKNLLFVTTGVYLVVIIVSAFKLLKLNLKNATKTNQLEKKILETQLKLKEQELKYLKMQIHPHFLFNTLNTMYGFALKKADETPEMILKLSNLLDYILYQVDKPFVSLTEETNHIKDYIALEQLRFNDTLSVSFIAEDIIETTNIAPMLLMPFVENSFKHGVIKNGTLKIDITISCEENNLIFNIKNTSQANTNTKPGIGLENIKKRLELLYKDQYTLEITDNEATFEVLFKLDTKNVIQNV
ncbi:sensor histidine kinase [Lacinutrix jangbogonensis]|uniref:sensor histidine kinase n=1 Tax=Lacinutrix jangbogonensis TaxID=1469557 RepID=UPI00053D9931|nr:histidine kinase [Lacinutrix jangbogonensis]